MANKFLDYIGLNHLWKKIKTLLNSKSDIGHTHSANEVSDLSQVAKDGDYGSLSNTPCYMSPFNITWGGDTTGLEYATTTEVSDLGSVLYYQLYNIPPDSNIVKGSKVTMIAGNTPYTLVVMSENIIDDGNNNYHLLFPAFNELIPLVFCISTPDTITVESNGASFTITFDEKGVYLVNSFGSYISEFYKEAKKLDIELLPDVVFGKNKCPQLPIGVYVGGYVYDYMNYVVLSNYTNAYYDNITSDSFTIPVFIYDSSVTSTNGTVSLKIVTEIDTSSLSVSRYIDVSVEIVKLYSNKSYLILASKQSDGSWKGKTIGNVDIPIDSSPTSDSENLITSGGVYTAIDEAIPSSLPANGGNADTVDGKHASDFADATHTHSYNSLTNMPIISKTGYSGSSDYSTPYYRYFYIGHMVVDNSSDYGNYTFTGRMGGYEDTVMATYQINLMNRSTARDGNTIFSTVSAYGNVDEALKRCDMLVLKNDDNSHDVYLKVYGWYAFNFNWETWQHSIEYTGEMLESIDESKVLWRLSTAPKTILDKSGKFSASGGISADTVDDYHIRIGNEGDTGLAGYITFIV